MNISFDHTAGWNDLRLTLIEEFSTMGDTIIVCLHQEDYSPLSGHTVKVSKPELVRAAQMLDVSYFKELKGPRNEH